MGEWHDVKRYDRVVLPSWQPDPSLIAEAIAAYHPPRRHDPDDITTWSAADLDELAVLAVTELPGFEVDYLGDGQHDAPHGINRPSEQT